MIRVGLVPFSFNNTYQRLFRGALEHAGLSVTTLEDRRWLPVAAVRREGLQVVHMDWPDPFITGRNRLLAWLKRRSFLRRLDHLPCRLAWTVHNLHSHDAADPAGEQAMVQRLVDRCAGIMVHSHAAEQALRSTYRVAPGTCVRVIPHGHYIGEYPNDRTRDQARQRLGLAPEARVVLSLGNLRPYKGLDSLAAAFTQIARPGDVLLMAGQVYPGLDVEALRRQGQACPSGVSVRIDCGLVPKEDVQDYYNAADVVALPFRAILNSGSALLAQSFGRCVVAPALGSLPEVLCDDGFFGYDPDQPDALVRTLGAALERSDLIDRGPAVRDYLRTHYDWTEIGAKVRGLYETILK